MSKMGSHYSFGHLKHKLWPKEGPGVELPGVRQFDSRPLNVENRPLPEVRIGSAIRCWKISTKATTSVQTSLRSERAVGSYELPKSRDSTRDNFGTISGLQLGSPGNLCHLDVAPEMWRRVYYREYGGGILPSPGCGESCGPKCPWLVPTPKGPKMNSNHFVWFHAGLCEWVKLVHSS
jgi:hypothetical protein